MNEAAKNTVAAALRELRGSLPPSEARVARTLLGGYPLAGIGTIADLAERARVSSPTVLRLIARLGYTTFGDFQRALLEEIEKVKSEKVRERLLANFYQSLNLSYSLNGWFLHLYADELKKSR